MKFETSKLCAVCKKELRVYNGVLVLSQKESEIAEEELEEVKQNFGSYPIRTDYYVCYECLLRTLGVKP